MSHLFSAISVKKQSFYQMLQRQEAHLGYTEQVLMLVNKIREDHPCMGVREIYFKLNPQGMGRDKFEQFCFERGYRVRKQKNFRITTDSRGVTRFPNLIKGIEVTAVNQVLVSDITYYEMHGKFYYITLIMDLFNREIVGSCASISLRTEDTTLPALLQVKKNRGQAALAGAIIHSDGGGQYYSTEFKKLTKKLKMSNSMTEESVFENPHAERLNGTIKNSYLYSYAPETFEELKKQLKRAEHMYNNEKPHKALKGMTPVQYRTAYSIDFENNSSKVQSYFPKSTENKHHQLDLMNKKKNKITSNSVNVI
ncbi:IS3 family transposase [Roseimarinus sediminis]|uniref:IS3 family transposase n=1 Tax=Roseimarinus sediminis TaxID=1610899 RepID=UPI003D224B9B